MKTTTQNTLEKRETGYQQLSHEIARNYKLSKGARCLYIYINSHSEQWHFSVASIANYLKESVATIQREIKELKKAGFLEIERIKGTKEYKYILLKTPSNREYLINQELKKGIQKETIEMLQNALENAQITKETKDKIFKEFSRIAKTKWLD